MNKPLTDIQNLPKPIKHEVKRVWENTFADWNYYVLTTWEDGSETMQFSGKDGLEWAKKNAEHYGVKITESNDA